MFPVCRFHLKLENWDHLPNGIKSTISKFGRKKTLICDEEIGTLQKSSPLTFYGFSFFLYSYSQDHSIFNEVIPAWKKIFFFKLSKRPLNINRKGNSFKQTFKFLWSGKHDVLRWAVKMQKGKLISKIDSKF